MHWITALIVVMIIAWLISEITKPNGGGKTQL